MCQMSFAVILFHLSKWVDIPGFYFCHHFTHALTHTQVHTHMFQVVQQIVCRSNGQNNKISFIVTGFCFCCYSYYCCTVQMMMMICRVFVCPIFCEKLYFSKKKKKCRRKTFCSFVRSFVCPRFFNFFLAFQFGILGLAYVWVYVSVCAFLCLLIKFSLGYAGFRSLPEMGRKTIWLLLHDYCFCCCCCCCCFVDNNLQSRVNVKTKERDNFMKYAHEWITIQLPLLLLLLLLFLFLNFA